MAIEKNKNLTQRENISADSAIEAPPQVLKVVLLCYNVNRGFCHDDAVPTCMRSVKGRRFNKPNLNAINIEYYT